MSLRSKSCGLCLHRRYKVLVTALSVFALFLSASSDTVAAVAPTISSFSAFPSFLTPGNSTILSWAVSGNPTPTVSIDPGIGTLTGASAMITPTLTTTYTLTASNSAGSVTAQTTVTVSVSLPTFPITASAGEGGSISPSGTVSVTANNSQTFAIKPGSGYQISSVIADGSPVGPVYYYTFANVTGPHTISATFIPGQQSNGGWQLTFSDEFNDAVVDRNTWTTHYIFGYTNNDELEGYADDDVTESGGQLHLKAEKRTLTFPDGHTYNYTSGLINNYTVFAQTYGYFEMRAKVPGGNGFWPAFWLIPSDGSWPPEIDVMEILSRNPSTVVMTLHWGTSDSNHQSQGGTWSGPDFTQDYHVFAIDWEPNAVTWYIDGVQRYQIVNSPNVPTIPLYLVANLAVGGSWPGNPDASTPFPSFMDIDYIRAWTRVAFGGYSTIPGPNDPIPTKGGPDIQAPSVPTNLSAMAVSPSQINLSWSASSDNVGVAGYKVYRNGSQVATVTSGTSFPDTHLTPSTSYSFAVAAFDAAGNQSVQSSPVSATTQPDTVAPTVLITRPQAGATVSGVTTVSASASDNVGVRSVQFTLDGSNLGSAITTSPFTNQWNTVGVTDGDHVLGAMATDTAGNVGTSSPVSVRVNNTTGAVTLGQHGSSTTSSASSLSATFPSTVAAGDLIVVAVASSPYAPVSSPVTDSMGNVYAIAGSIKSTSAHGYTAIYYTISAKSGTDTITFKASGSRNKMSMVIAEFKGVQASSPLDGAKGSTGRSSLPSSGNMTPKASGDLVIGAGTHDKSNTTKAGSGFTMIEVATEDGVSHRPLAMEYMIQNSTSSIAAVFNLSSSDSWAQNGALFKHR